MKRDSVLPGLCSARLQAGMREFPNARLKAGSPRASLS